MASVLPGRRTEVKFEISAMAADVIGRRGGELWIWPSPDRSAYATTEPPGDPHRWTDYPQGKVVAHVDEAIVPPQRWVVTLPNSPGRHLDARWNGKDPREEFGRLPVIDPPEAEAGATAKTWSRFVAGGLVVVVGVVWLLGIVGLLPRLLPGWRFPFLDAGRLVVPLLVAALASTVSWIVRRGRRV